MKKNEVLKYIKEDELDIQNANASIFIAEVVFSAYADSPKIHNREYGPILSHFSTKREEFFYFYQILNAGNIRRINREIFLNYLKNPKTLTSIIKKHKGLENKTDKVWRYYQKSKNLKSSFKKLMAASREWWYYASIGEDKGEVINNEVAPRFAKRHNIGLEKAKEILGVLSHPERPAVLNLERSNFLRICLAVMDNDKKEIEKQLRLYLKNYFWFETDFYRITEVTEKYLLEKAKKEIEKSGREGITKELSGIEEKFKNFRRGKEKIKKQFKFSAEDKKDIIFAKKIIKWVDQRKLGMMKQLYYIFMMLKDTSKKFQLSYKDLSFYTIKEVESLLAANKRVSGKEIGRRKEDVFLVFERGKDFQRFYGQDQKELLDAVVKKNQSQEEIKGSVASAGDDKLITGVVNIIIDPSKEKFDDGTILVTSMTRVEFVPLMRRAKAVITNEGGVACHAAIVSREMGIPCIIGTRVATKVLRNGDAVEMDLEKGVVRILKKS